ASSTTSEKTEHLRGETLRVSTNADSSPHTESTGGLPGFSIYPLWRLLFIRAEAAVRRSNTSILCTRLRLKWTTIRKTTKTTASWQGLFGLITADSPSRDSFYWT